MVDLARAVDALVDAAAREVEPRALKTTVEKVLVAFDEAAEDARNSALRTIGRALAKVEGRGAQILSLAIGALVEGGASPEVAWPAVGPDLIGLLHRATAFAAAAVKQAGDEHVDTAIESAGAAVAKKKPREAAAWKALPSRCLAAVACITRSKALRTRVRKDHKLQEAAWALSDVVSEVGYLLQALRIIDDEILLVLAPEAGRGWRVTVEAMPSNAELYILLADTLLGDPKRGRLPGKRPAPKLVTAIRDGAPPKGASSAKVPFHLVAWTAVEADGSLPPADPHATDHWIPMEGIPWDIPKGPFKERVVLIQNAPSSRSVPGAPSFESLRPDVRLTETLSPDEVERTMLKLGEAAAKIKRGPATTPARTAPPKETQPKKTRPKKTLSKKTLSKKTPSKKTRPKKTRPKKTRPKKTRPKKTRRAKA
jgi:hypothetical protein